MPWAAVTVSALMAASAALFALLVFAANDGSDVLEVALVRDSGDLIRPSYDGDAGVPQDAAPARGRWM
jgi:hypothetical protein